MAASSLCRASNMEPFGLSVRPHLEQPVQEVAKPAAALQVQKRRAPLPNRCGLACCDAEGESMHSLLKR